jgi:lysophospholipase L1-like esterase
VADPLKVPNATADGPAMRFPSLSLAAALIALAVPTTASAATKSYVALGDSLSVGVQPDAAGKNQNSDRGYADLLAKRAGTKLVKLGCGYATTTSFLKGGRPCSPGRSVPYTNTSAKTSQLAYAEKYLRTHRGQVRIVTLDIGPNDVAGCVTDGQLDGACLGKGLDTIKKNIPTILKRLRQAAGAKTKIAAMTIYDPFLAMWLKGDDQSRGLAQASVGIAKASVNDVIRKAAKREHVKVADVATAFSTYVPFDQMTGDQPTAVAEVCRLTWMCSAGNIHANDDGYHVIADTFAKALAL